MYLQLLKSMFERENYEQYADVLSPERLEELNQQAPVCFDILKKFYKEYDDSPSLEMVKDYHLNNVLKTVSKNGAQVDNATALYEMLETTEVDNSAKFLAEQVHLSDIVNRIGSSLVKHTANPDRDEVLELLETTKAQLERENKEEASYLPTVEEFCKTLDSVHKWDMPFQALHDRTHGFGPSRSMLVFALSNVGKSSFCLAAAVGFMKQGAKVLDLSITEDPFSRRMPRLMQAAYGLTYMDIEQDKEGTYERFLAEYGDQYAFVYDAGMTFPAIRKHIKAFEPDIVIVDNFTKINRKSKQDVNHAKSIGLNLAELKGLSEEYNFGLIPVCQAADTANGKTVLTMRDIADSKVDVPAELEIAVGIAAAPSSKELLYFNLAKNKLGPEEHFAMAFKPETCQFEDV